MRTAWISIGVSIGLLVLSAAGVDAARAQAPDDSTYTVKTGDTLYSIARRFGVSVEALQAWNDLKGTTIQIGQTLRVRPPRPAPPSPSPDTTATPSPDTATQTAHPPPLPTPPAPDTGRGEPPSEATPAVSDTAAPGDATALEDTTARDTTALGEVSPYGTHSTAAGDTFVNLALRYGTTADTLFALNDSTTAPLSSGRRLRLPQRFGPPTHVAQEGETIYSIAGQYGVSARALQRVNALDTAGVRVGQRLRIPGRIAPAPPPPGRLAPPDTTGPVAVYPELFAGRLTASGAAYDPDAFVASHSTLPFGSLVLLTNTATGRSTFVRIIDRGPTEEGVLMDISTRAAQQMNLSSRRNQTVALHVVWIGE